jgi:hypothetical protein
MPLLEVLNNKIGKLSSLQPIFPGKRDYLISEGNFTKKELVDFNNCKYPNGNIIKEFLRFKVLVKRYIFKKYIWNK